MKKILFALTLLLLSFAVIAQGLTLPGTVEGSVDYLALLSELIANPKALLSTSGVALLVFLTVQFIKKYGLTIFKDLKGSVQFAIITVLGLVYSVLITKLNGDASSSKAIMTVLGSGGAAALFGAFKLLFPNLIGEKK